jgi:hypothetical protein
MNTLALSLLFVYISSTDTTIEGRLDVTDGLSYFYVAEEVATDSTTDKRFAKELYVLSASIDPSLRESAIIGLASIEENAELKQQLEVLRSPSFALLVPAVVLPQGTGFGDEFESIEHTCVVLSKIRSGKKLSDSEAQVLKQQRHLQPESIDILLHSATRNRQQASDVIMYASLQVELALLGGATLWSADYASTKGKPAMIENKDDLAELIHVDSTKRRYVQGNWVE